MNTEKLIAKGVEKHFNGQQVLFKVSSLNEHFEGLQIHDSDILLIEEEAYIKVGDVNFDNATANEVAPKVEEELYEESEEANAEIPLEEIEVVEPEIVDTETPEE